MSSVLVTASSSRAPDPPGCGLSLFEHQKAVLWACRQAERQYANKGLALHMSLPVGSGKTIIVLALILSGSPSECTVIVVPPCIHNQWISEMKRFLPADVKVSCVLEYSQVIAALHNPTSLLSSRVVLCTYSYWSTLRTAIDDSRVSRIVIDESHTGVTKSNDGIGFGVDRRLASTLWYVSATPTSGSDVQVCCSTEFIETSIRLPPPVTTTLRTRNNPARRVLRHMVSDDEMQAADAMDFSFIGLSKGMVHASNEKEAVSAIRSDIQDSVLDSEMLLRSIRKQIKRLQEDLELLSDAEDEESRERREESTRTLGSCKRELVTVEARLEEAQSKLAKMSEKIKEEDMCIVCYGSFDEGEVKDKVIIPCCLHATCGECISAVLLRKHSCPMCRADIDSEKLVYLNKNRPPPQEEEEEEEPVPDVPIPAEVLLGGGGDNQDLVRNAFQCSTKGDVTHMLAVHLNTKAGPRKVLLFSDYVTTLDFGTASFKKAGFDCLRLDDEGTVDGIERVMSSFASSPRPTVLTVWGALYGSGMNIQAATDIVFTHRTTPEMEKQVIGRAQRLGREGPLHIWFVLHGDE